MMSRAELELEPGTATNHPAVASKVNESLINVELGGMLWCLWCKVEKYQFTFQFDIFVQFAKKNV